MKSRNFSPFFEKYVTHSTLDRLTSPFMDDQGRFVSKVAVYPPVDERPHSLDLLEQKDIHVNLQISKNHYNNQDFGIKIF
jgi:hypothetical protein